MNLEDYLDFHFLDAFRLDQAIMRQELVSKDLIDLANKFYLIFHFIRTLICSVTYL